MVYVVLVLGVRGETYGVVELNIYRIIASLQFDWPSLLKSYKRQQIVYANNS